MPELPEVQTVINSIKDKIINKKITNYKIYYNRVCYNTSSVYASKKILNQSIISIERIGKNIVIKLSDCYIIFHLRMTGYLYHSKNKKTTKPLRYVLKLSNGTYLNFEDIRKFGGFYYFTNLKYFYSKLGVDPFSKLFTYSWLYMELSNRRAKIKSLLLRQDLICGLGNIYIDEVLWKSKISPQLISKKITKNKAKVLHYNIINILKDSIEFHGTTIMNFKFDNMKTGNYKNKLQVYGRKDQNCNRCKESIITTKISGRTSYFCRFCQR